MLFVHEKSHFQTLMIWGATIHVLGFAGRVLCLCAAAQLYQTLALRVILRFGEKDNRLKFLDDFVSIDKNQFLRPEKKTKLLKKLQFLLILTKVVRTTCVNTAYVVVTLLTLLWVLRVPSIVNAFAWTFWCVITYMIIYYCVGDHFRYGVFWFSCRTHVAFLLEELHLRLQGITADKETGHRRLSSWFQDYDRVFVVLSNFDYFSRNFIPIFCVCTTLLNSACFFFYVRSDQVYLSTIIAMEAVVYTIQAFVQLSAAAKIHSKGMKLYVDINRAFHIFMDDMTLKQRLAMRTLIKDASSQRVSLNEHDRNPFSQMSLFNYEVGFISMFLMMLDFLEVLL